VASCEKVTEDSSRQAYDEREHGHCGNFFNMLWALPGASRGGPLATGAYLKEQSWYYDMAGFLWFQGWNDLCADWTYNNRMKPGGYDRRSSRGTLERVLLAGQQYAQGCRY
jgi:hypothetical protein